MSLAQRDPQSAMFETSCARRSPSGRLSPATSYVAARARRASTPRLAKRPGFASTQERADWAGVPVTRRTTSEVTSNSPRSSASYDPTPMFASQGGDSGVDAALEPGFARPRLVAERPVEHVAAERGELAQRERLLAGEIERLVLVARARRARRPRRQRCPRARSARRARRRPGHGRRRRGRTRAAGHRGTGSCAGTRTAFRSRGSCAPSRHASGRGGRPLWPTD